jgi:2-polyprenyl-3-methyl-5-hydroxy-6-metoxy-1,4-benzoquinol methylase
MDIKRQQIEEYYKEKLNEDYQGDFYQPRYHKFLELLEGKKKARILDIGCGAGDFLLMLKKQGFQKVEGLDYSRQAKNFAEKRGLKVALCDIEEETPSFKKKFDVIVCGDILEHVFEPDFFLNKIKKLLKKNGWLLISVPNAGWYLNGILLTLFPRFLRLSPAFGVWTHCNQFTFHTLKKLLQDSGFDVVELVGIPFVQPKPPKEGIIRKITKSFLKLPIRFTDLFSNIYPPLFSSHLVVLATKK